MVKSDVRVSFLFTILLKVNIIDNNKGEMTLKYIANIAGFPKEPPTLNSGFAFCKIPKD
ncbi:hypothetical protein CCYN74_20019 [Capnocytophaga cynodegmi]|uniref:Uncharacterized protein n=1 Tax=Capnocytophaga cynodegmi TaxID=28189 RepID=A0A0B7HGM2_9FLAO|nr:hypothetical protein CCYN74_20019 [Capnocytophaga cynodegmi]